MSPNGAEVRKQFSGKEIWAEADTIDVKQVGNKDEIKELTNEGAADNRKVRQVL